MGASPDAQVELHLKKAREVLQADFEGVLASGEIDAIFDDSVSRMRGEGHIQDYVPALAEKLARERLRGAGQAAGALTKNVPEVLFVALHDTGRGQMGAAMMRSLGGGRVNVHSAGTAGQVVPIEPGVAEAMREMGLDIDDEYSKPLTPEVLRSADVVVTMGRSAGIVDIPDGTRHVDWRIGDPGGAPPEEVRRVRDDIRLRVEQLLGEIAPD